MRRMATLLLASLLMSPAMANVEGGKGPDEIWVSVDKNGRKVYSNIQTKGARKIDTQPLPEPVPMKGGVGETKTAQDGLGVGVVSRGTDKAIGMDKASSVDERERRKAVECTEMAQELDRLKRARTSEVDPVDGGRLEERRARDISQRMEANRC